MQQIHTYVPMYIAHLSEFVCYNDLEDIKQRGKYGKQSNKALKSEFLARIDHISALIDDLSYDRLVFYMNYELMFSNILEQQEEGVLQHAYDKACCI